MERSVTIVDIARAVGVSKSTVSLVLRDATKVRAETVAAVRAAMHELGYVYNRSAAQLRSPQSRIVGMVINDLSNPFFAELAIGIERVLRTSGYIPFLANTAESVLRQAEVVRSMREHGAAGIILSPAADTASADINALVTLGQPIVLAIRRVPGARLSLIASDNRGGATQATSHLLALGHRRIAFIGGMGHVAVQQDRLAGFTDALVAAGLTPDPALVVASPPTRDGGFAAMTTVLGWNARPTAAVCFSDVVAIGTMLALRRHGLEPGADFALVGFDDTAEAEQTTPALTTVSTGVGDLGERAAQMLLRKIASGSDDAETFIGETRLVIRQSCGAPRGFQRSNRIASP
jgi:LacI family transcriptional regulator